MSQSSVIKATIDGELVSPEKTQDVKTQVLASDDWGAYQRNDFSEPDSYIFPYMENH